MRYIEYELILGDAPPNLILNEIEDIAHVEKYSNDNDTMEENKNDSIWDEGKELHLLSEDKYMWTFSLIYKEGIFDIIKWKTANAWKSNTIGTEDIRLQNSLFIGASGGVFFVAIDEDIEENFNKFADMLDLFIEKSSEEAPFIVYAVIENKQKIAELKTNKYLLKNLADVKKWTTQHGGEFRLENLTEMKMNLTYLINEYSHYFLNHSKSKTQYSNLKLGEVHFLDYKDITSLQEIEEALRNQVSKEQTIDHLLSELIFKFLKTHEYQEEIYEPKLVATTQDRSDSEVRKVSLPSKMKVILEEIRKGIRRQCPKCFNKDRDKIREVLDKDNVIYNYGTDVIYGLKYICGECGHEWKIKK
ncbi:MAG: hypothetical protein GF383_04105 [Candidatus Lokiarchaeota archaeon]|nr:hypothetical protein [Candidatus Lokiarchaeota archaeon]MBD3338937.1 hypothetical protein [Candidatus Lokiarchaeota archaeon]